MDSSSIRKTFVDFFAERGHTIRPSAPVIPVDPTLLLVNAGMVPFKPYFLGQEKAPWLRAASVQKAVRTIDIDIIGSTERHLSFFEMLGNFSFGDYFKKEAMKWAYELVTDGYGLDPELLWFTAYEEDPESAELWIDHVGVPSEKVQLGGKDNFWHMGVAGPCGPCAEIFYDRGSQHGADGGPLHGGEERFVEIWNLVFMQYIQDEPYHVVGELEKKSIDTGMGHERLAAILQNVDSVFDIDVVAPVRRAAEEFTGVEYGTDPVSDTSLRILSDHGRTMSVLVGDQVVPSNEGRGYILRRIIRRAVRHAWQLGGEGLVTPKLVEATVNVLGDWYTELADKRDLIVEVVSREETNFRRTLESGFQLLETALDETTGEEPLDGKVAFKLHDTYGFPIELTKEIVGERGGSVDEEVFQSEMELQRKRARKQWKGGDEAVLAEFYRSVMDEIGPTRFIGYEAESGTGRILAIVADGQLTENAEEGRKVEIFVDVTPFYGESGGQVGDTGTISTATGRLEVTDVKHAVQGFHAHRAEVVAGSVQVGQEAQLQIDSARRTAIRKSHTGTHILHHALREVLGDHAHQAGSLVEPGRLRFDFTHFSAMSDSELAEVERRANLRVIANEKVETIVTTQDEARKMGALAFFGDKYGETVRVLKVGDSVEFCGGTHTNWSGEIGPIVVVSESSIGSNNRRIEALTGEAAYEHLVGIRDSLNAAGQLLRTSGSEVPARVKALMEKVESLEEELNEVRAQRRGDLSGELSAGAETTNEVRWVAQSVGEMPPDQLRRLAAEVLGRLGKGVVILGSTNGGKGALVAAVSKDLVGSGPSAADLIAEGARVLGGGGSRDPELCQAGGPNGAKIEDAISAARDSVGRALKGS